jgi:5-aminopentanamidase
MPRLRCRVSVAGMLVAAAQLTAVPGDIEANVAAHVELVHDAAARGARLVAFPELSLTGYELEQIAAVPELTLSEDDPRLTPLRHACAVTGVTAVPGLAMPAPGGGRQLCALAMRGDGRPVRYAKTFLHGDEPEVFVAGDGPAVFEVDGRRLGLAICGDAAAAEHARAAAAAGAEVYVCGAIFPRGTENRIVAQAAGRARETGMSVLFALASGPADPFDSSGGSGVWNSAGEPLVRLGDEAPALAVAELGPGRPT